MKDWMTYEIIQELKRNHLNKSQVSRRLNIDYKTVAKYWDMPPDEFSACKNRAQRRRRKADVYERYNGQPGGGEVLISLRPRRRGYNIAQMTSVKAGGREGENSLSACCQFYIEQP